jgi:hypothetical protein
VHHHDAGAGVISPFRKKKHEYDRDTRAKQRIKEQINFVNLVVCFTSGNGKKCSNSNKHGEITRESIITMPL